MSENTRSSFPRGKKLNPIKKESNHVKEMESASTQATTILPKTPASGNFTELETIRTPATIIVPETLTPNKSYTQKPTQNALPMSSDASKPAMYYSSLPPTSRPKETMQVLRTRCKQLGISIFFQNHIAVRSLGFTSAIPGEGKTFLARLTAEAMAEDNDVPVVLLECNWENPTLSSAYNLAPSPGLSDWLLGKYPLEAIRRQVTSSLTIIPAGSSNNNETRLLRILQQRDIHSVLTNPNEILIIDLPSTVTTAYGPFAAQLANSLILVVRVGVTPEPFITEASAHLKDLSVHGIILNQVASRIPRWLRRIL